MSSLEANEPTGRAPTSAGGTGTASLATNTGGPDRAQNQQMHDAVAAEVIEEAVGGRPARETVDAAQPGAAPVVVVKEHGLWCDIKNGRTAVLPYWLAIILLIINVVASGVGTLLSAIHPNAKGMRTKIVVIGLIQLIFLWTIVPWVWSVIYGALMVKHAEREGEDTN